MKKLILIPLMLALSVLVSCAGITNSSSAELVVQYATIKFINSDAAPVARAKKVLEIASEAKTFFDNDTLPLDQIEELIRSKIKWSELDPADTLLANALITRVTDEVNSVDGLPEERRVSGSKVLSWIITGAKLAGG